MPQKSLKTKIINTTTITPQTAQVESIVDDPNNLELRLHKISKVGPDGNQVVIQTKRDTGSNLTTYNPTLNSGEICYDSTEKNIKIGDGSNRWNSLPYFEREKNKQLKVRLADILYSGSVIIKPNHSIVEQDIYNALMDKECFLYITSSSSSNVPSSIIGTTVPFNKFGAAVGANNSKDMLFPGSYASYALFTRYNGNPLTQSDVFYTLRFKESENTIQLYYTSYTASPTTGINTSYSDWHLVVEYSE